MHILHCLIVIKLFTLYSSKYQKDFQIFCMGRCHFSQFLISPHQISWKPQNFLSKLLEKQKVYFYVRFMFYVRPLKILQCTFRCLQTHVMQPWNPVSQEVSCDMLDAVEKHDRFLILKKNSKNYRITCQTLQQYLNDQENVFKLANFTPQKETKPKYITVV